jgi:hypothetical protein
VSIDKNKGEKYYHEQTQKSILQGISDRFQNCTSVSSVPQTENNRQREEHPGHPEKT